MLFAGIAVEKTTYSFDRIFSYKVPEELESLIKPGVRVMVPFGTSNGRRIGMVMSLMSETEGKTKDILSVLDEKPVLSEEMLGLVPIMKNRYYCTFYEAVKTMLPFGIGYEIQNSYILNEDFKDFDKEAYTDTQWQIIMLLRGSVRALPAKSISSKLGINEKSPDLLKLMQIGAVIKVNTAASKVRDATVRMLRPVLGYNGKFTPKQQYVYETLCDVGTVSEKELNYYTGVSAAVIKNMVKKGLIESFEYEVYRRPKISISRKKQEMPVLSKEQSEVYESLVKDYLSPEAKTALLYGITGSGKTSVFLKLIDHVINDGKSVILTVPEISLTAQTISLFTDVFGENIAVFHSALSLGERLDEWKRVNRGEAKIVIGTRSAIFAPVKNLGLIVMDEEQEHTYKSESSPRYDAREIARIRCKFNNSLCLFSSATPSVETFYMAQRGFTSLYKLESRFGDAILPNVVLADMNNESFVSAGEIIGETLANGLKENFENKKQSIVLLNRRGYHTFVACNDCKEVISCPHCSISLTYHNANGRMMCHYCGYSVKYIPKCPSCGGEKLSLRGMGTQRAEEELSEIVPGAKILRIDTDSVSQRFSLENKLDEFAAGNYDIMVGTQMVAKGLNFENVTLVGVLSADQALYSDDYRCYERTFDLLTQVVGRAGRGKYKGTAIIQTYVPENPYLELSAKQDYEGFYNREIEFRKALLYPPFADIVVIGFVGGKDTLVRQGANYFMIRMGELAHTEYSNLPLRILKVAPAAISKVNNKYRYKIIVKCKNTAKFREMLSKLLMEFSSNKEYKDITAYADNNPYSIM